MNKKVISIFLGIIFSFFFLFGINKTKNKKINENKIAITQKDIIKQGDDIIEIARDSNYIIGKGTVDDPLRVSTFLKRKFNRSNALLYSRNWVSNISSLTSCFVTDLYDYIYAGDKVKFPNGVLTLEQVTPVQIGDSILYVHTIESPYNRLSTISDIRGKDSIIISKSRLYYFEPSLLSTDSLVYLMDAYEGRLAKITSYDFDNVHFHFNIPDDTLSVLTLKDTTSLIFTPKEGTIINYNDLDLSHIYNYKIDTVKAIDPYASATDSTAMFLSMDMSWVTIPILNSGHTWEITWNNSDKYPDAAIGFDPNQHIIYLENLITGAKYPLASKFSSGSISFYTQDPQVIPFKQSYKGGHWILENTMPIYNYPNPNRYTSIGSTHTGYIPSNMLCAVEYYNKANRLPFNFYFQYRDKFFNVDGNYFGEKKDTCIIIKNAPIKELAPCLINIPENIPTTISHDTLTIHCKWDGLKWDKLSSPIFADGYGEYAIMRCAYIKAASLNDTVFIATSSTSPYYREADNKTFVKIDKIYYPYKDSINGRSRLCVPILDTIINTTNHLSNDYTLGVNQIRKSKILGTSFHSDTIAKADSIDNPYVGYLAQNIFPIFPFYDNYSLYRKSFGMAIGVDDATQSKIQLQKIDFNSNYFRLKDEIFDPSVKKINRIWGVDENAQHIQEGPIKLKTQIPITFIPSVGEKIKPGDYLMTYNHQMAIVNYIEVAKDSGKIIEGEFMDPADIGVNFLKGINLSNIPQGRVTMRDFNENNKIINVEGGTVDNMTPCLVFDENGILGVHHGDGYFTTIKNPKYTICGEIDITPYVTKDTVVGSQYETKFWKSSDKVLCKAIDEPVVEFDSESGEHFRWAGNSQLLYSTDTTCHYLTTFLNAYFNDVVSDSDYVPAANIPRHWGGRYILVPYADQIGVTHKYIIKNPQSHSYYMTPRKNWTGCVALFYYDGEGLNIAKDIKNQVPVNVAQSYNNIFLYKNKKKKKNSFFKSIFNRWHQNYK